MLTRETTIDAGAHHGLTDRQVEIFGDPCSKCIFIYHVSKPFVELTDPSFLSPWSIGVLVALLVEL